HQPWSIDRCSATVAAWLITEFGLALNVTWDTGGQLGRRLLCRHRTCAICLPAGSRPRVAALDCDRVPWWTNHFLSLLRRGCGARAARALCRFSSDYRRTFGGISDHDHGRHRHRVVDPASLRSPLTPRAHHARHEAADSTLRASLVAQAFGTVSQG